MSSFSNNRKFLIKLLSSSIRGEEYICEYEEGIDWEAVFKEAAYHEVASLIYPFAKKHQSFNTRYKDLIEKLQKRILELVFIQTRNFSLYEKVLSLLSQAGISIIVLKGLVLKDLYPYPVLRTMGDVDILINPNDYDKSKKVLVDEGYSLFTYSGNHAVFIKEKYSVIELHWTLLEFGISDTSLLEENAWKRAVNISVGNVQVYTLYPQDKLIYLFLHLAVHFTYGGFGLRQLCDLVLYIEKYQKEINWTVFLLDAETYQIREFTLIVLKACIQLFNLQLPDIIINIFYDVKYSIDDFLEEILGGGVFGKVNTEEAVAGWLLYEWSRKVIGN